MKGLRNNKGMTLVEVTITLLIAAIIMVMAGSILLSSVSFYDQHAISDLDKSTLDSAFENVGNQLEYASGIKISQTPLSSEKIYKSWHYYHVKDGRLYARLGNDTAKEQDLYTDDFYHNRKMVLKVKKLGEDKLSLKMELKEDDTTVYDRKRTITIRNIALTLKEEGDIGIIAPGEEEYTNYYIYYQPKATEKVDQEVSGTVADEMFCLQEDPSLNRGEYSAPNIYYPGEFVTYNGQYYRFQGKPGKKIRVKIDSPTPDKAKKTTKLISEVWSDTSAYQIGDIVAIIQDDGTKMYYESQIKNNIDADPTLGNAAWWKNISVEDLPKDKVCRIYF